MSREAYKAGYDKIDWSSHRPFVPSQPKARGPSADYPCPRVMTDTMELTEHVDGKFYDSKSAFRRVTKENGMVEMGNDPARLRRPEPPKVDPQKRREDVKKATAQVLGS